MSTETEKPETIVINAMDYDFGDISSIQKVNGNLESTKELSNLYLDKPSSVSEKLWNEFNTNFPWLYHKDGKLSCYYCEESFKQNKGMIATSWTGGKISKQKMDRYNASRTRFERHGKTHNHLLAIKIKETATETNDWDSLTTKYKWLKGDIDNTRCSLCEQAYKTHKDSMIVTIWTCPDLNKQEPKTHFSTLHRLDRHEKCKNHLLAIQFQQSPPESVKRSRKSAVPVKQQSETILPAAISLQQYRTLQSRYTWLQIRDNKSFYCDLCKNTIIAFESTANLSLISRRILAHCQSDSHVAQSQTTADSRTTRLQRGVGPKVDYKRLSSGLDDVAPAVRLKDEPVGRWSCPQCKSAFTDSTNLLEHISLCDYQSERQVSCPCTTNTLFDTITKLDLHAAQEHPDQPLFSCYICSDRCTRLLALYDHMLVHHLIDWDPFEAFVAVKEPLIVSECLFCCTDFANNMELTSHYGQSQCRKYLQPTVLVEKMSEELVALHRQELKSFSDEIDENEENPEPEKPPKTRMRRSLFSLTLDEIGASQTSADEKIHDKNPTNDELLRKTPVNPSKTTESSSKIRNRRGFFSQILSELGIPTETLKCDTVGPEIRHSIRTRKSLFAQKFAEFEGSESPAVEDNRNELIKPVKKRRGRKSGQMVDTKTEGVADAKFAANDNETVAKEEQIIEDLVESKKPIKRRTSKKFVEIEETKETTVNMKEGTTEAVMVEDKENTVTVDSSENESKDIILEKPKAAGEKPEEVTPKEIQDEKLMDEEEEKLKDEEEEKLMNEEEEKLMDEEKEKLMDEEKEKLMNEEEEKLMDEEEEHIVTNEISEENTSLEIISLNNTLADDKYEIITLNNMESPNEPKAYESQGISLSELKICLEKAVITPIRKQRRKRTPSEKLSENNKFFARPLEPNEKRIRVPSEKLRDNAYVPKSLIDDIKRVRIPSEKIRETGDIVEKKQRRKRQKTKSLSNDESWDKISGGNKPRKSMPAFSNTVDLAKSPLTKNIVVHRRSTKMKDSLVTVKRSLTFAKRLRKSLDLAKKEHEPIPSQLIVKPMDRELISPSVELEQIKPRASFVAISVIEDEQDNHSSVDPIRLKKPILIKSQLSPPSVKSQLNLINEELSLPAELSFMDRMKRIRQLKKIRTEQQREQMMIVEKTVAEINEKALSNETIMGKSDKIQKLLNCEQYSMNDLKSILHNESKKRKLADADEYKPTKKTKVELTKEEKSVRFPCEVCQLKFRSLRSRDNHVSREHRGVKMFKCSLCQYTFTTHIGLRRHAHKFHQENAAFAVFGKDVNYSFQCHFCPLRFPNKNAINHHVTTVHRTEPEKQGRKDMAEAVMARPAAAAVAAAAVVVVDEFVDKLKRATPNSDPQECYQCNEMMDNEFELAIHAIEHEREQDSQMEANQFACPKCCRLFFGREGKTYLKDHYNIIHLQKPVPSCDECKTEFPSTWCYYEHKRTMRHCTAKKGAEQQPPPLSDPYDDLNDELRLAFVCSRCQTLVAGQLAQQRFEQHQIDCSLQLADESSSVAIVVAEAGVSECAGTGVDDCGDCGVYGDDGDDGDDGVPHVIDQS